MLFVLSTTADGTTAGIAYCCCLGIGFRVQGSGEGTGRIQGSEFRVQGGLGFRVYGLWLRVEG